METWHCVYSRAKEGQGGEPRRVEEGRGGKRREEQVPDPDCPGWSWEPAGKSLSLGVWRDGWGLLRLPAHCAPAHTPCPSSHTCGPPCTPAPLPCAQRPSPHTWRPAGGALGLDGAAFPRRMSSFLLARAYHSHSCLHVTSAFQPCNLATARWPGCEGQGKEGYFLMPPKFTCCCPAPIPISPQAW